MDPPPPSMRRDRRELTRIKPKFSPQRTRRQKYNPQISQITQILFWNFSSPAGTEKHFTKPNCVSYRQYFNPAHNLRNPCNLRLFVVPLRVLCVSVVNSISILACRPARLAEAAPFAVQLLV